ncbi:hypothetical protein PV325_004647, partial [Microctonus aethiopoides]
MDRYFEKLLVPRAQKKHENIYLPVVTKHAAAICIYVNEENTLSKTDTPMIWNRPPESQLANYRKGCTLESLFPSDKSNIKGMINNLFQTEIYATGIVICFKQPFLDYSPDGFIFDEEEFQLLDIKCPFSSANSIIVDYDNEASMVNYLIFNESNEVELKKMHKYYTQIEMS